MKKNPQLDDLPESDFLYGRKGPWPQPQPAHPLGEAAGVVHVPCREWIDWWLHVGSRYVLTLALVPYEYVRAILKPGLLPVEEKEFARLLSHSMMSKFITNQFDDEDRSIFKSFELTDKWLIDLEAMRVLRPFKGIHVSGTKVLLSRSGDDYTPLAIWVDATRALILPEQKDAWELARYYVLQGLAIAATLVVHPLIHFPLDCVNAITKTALPTWHPLFVLFEPHTRFTLSLENAVLNFKSSLLQSKWWMPYAPYPAHPNGLRDLLVEGYKGIQGNLSYPAYKFPMSPPPVPSSYGRFQDAYWPVFLRFAQEMLYDLQDGDHLAATWAWYVSKELPGFPENPSRDELIQAAASYLWQVSLGHSIDHYDYGNMDTRKVPLRLRAAPPTNSQGKVKLKTLVKFWDTAKYRMAQRLFFRPTTVTSLLGTDYDTQNARKRQAIARFKDELQVVDKKMQAVGICYIPLSEVAASIQY